MFDPRLEINWVIETGSMASYFPLQRYVYKKISREKV
jgi:hypothetical protein